MPMQDFELKFSQLVNGQLADKLPGLSQYRVGFQVLDKEDDGSRAVGINAFIINNIWAYVPAFFLNGKLSGMELMYLKQNDIFVPAQDNWVASLKNQGDDFLGHTWSEEDEKDSEEALSAEDVAFTDKVAFRGAADLLTREDLVKMIRIVPEGIAKPFIEKVAGLGDDALRTFVKALHGSADFANAVLMYHPPAELQKVAEVAQQMAVASVVEEDTDRVEFISMTDSSAKDLEDCEKKMLVRNGVFIRDDRKAVSKIFDEKVRSSVCSNPTASGIYDILLSDGSYKTMFLVMLPSRENYKGSCGKQVALIGIDDPGRYYLRGASDVFCREVQDVTSDEIKKAVGGQKPTKKLLVETAKDNGCLLVTQGDGRKALIGLHRCNNENPGKVVGDVTASSGLRLPYDSCSDSSAPCVATPEVVLEFSGPDGKLFCSGDTLFIPESAKVFQQVDYKDMRELRLGNLLTIHNRIVKEASLQPLRIRAIGNLAQITSSKGSTGLLDKTAALKHLVLTEGIFAGQAQQILKEASRDSKKALQYLIRYAAPYMTKSAASQESGPIETKAEVGGKKQNNNNDLTQGAIAKVTKAAEAGVKEVFDATVLQQLVSVADVSELRKDYLADMIKGMDRTGRMLFLYYWHSEEFEDRYGKDDISELEDSLKQAFILMGDLVLFLKEKMVYSESGQESLFGYLSEGIGGADASDEQ